jgi:AcrR family transcriptional regulator
MALDCALGTCCDTRRIMSARKKGALAVQLAESAIVAASVDVFARRGFAATRVEDLLEAAKLSRRTFYKYFSSKEAVLTALYEVSTRQLLEAIKAPPPPGKKRDALERVRHGMDLYLDYHVENASLVRVLVEQAILSDSPLYAARLRFHAELIRMLDDAVREKTGEAHDPMLYVALLSALEGLSVQMLATGATAKGVARAKRVVHLLMNRTLAL